MAAASPLSDKRLSEDSTVLMESAAYASAASTDPCNAKIAGIVQTSLKSHLEATPKLLRLRSWVGFSPLNPDTSKLGIQPILAINTRRQIWEELKGFQTSYLHHFFRLENSEPYECFLALREEKTTEDPEIVFRPISFYRIVRVGSRVRVIGETSTEEVESTLLSNALKHLHIPIVVSLYQHVVILTQLRAWGIAGFTKIIHSDEMITVFIYNNAECPLEILQIQKKDLPSDDVSLIEESIEEAHPSVLYCIKKQDREFESYFQKLAKSHEYSYLPPFCFKSRKGKEGMVCYYKMEKELSYVLTLKEKKETGETFWTVEGDAETYDSAEKAIEANMRPFNLMRKLLV